MLFIAAASTVVAFNACKKSSNPKPVVNTPVTTSLSFSTNGTAVSYNECSAGGEGVSPTFLTTIEALQTINSFGAIADGGFVIEIMQDINTIKPGQTFPVETTAGQSGSAIIDFSPDGASNYITQPANAQGSVTITDISATEMKGTFSAKLFAPADVSGTNVLSTITNGTFTASVSK